MHVFLRPPYRCAPVLGVEGLVHVSEMDWTNKNVHPSKLVNIGDEVDVVILDIDTERRRISLGMKQCQPNPWEQFAATHNKGDRVTGTIKSITDFGIFVGLEGGIDGLIHRSDITWADNSEAAIHNFTKGEEIETVVLAVDAERERISLGIKQLEKDPFSSYVAEYSKGSIVKGVAVAVEPKFVTVKLADGVEGQLKSSEISLDKKIEDARTEIKEVDDEAAAVEEYSPESGTGAKLGDILKGHLENK